MHTGDGLLVDLLNQPQPPQTFSTCFPLQYISYTTVVLFGPNLE